MRWSKAGALLLIVLLAWIVSGYYSPENAGKRLFADSDFLEKTENGFETLLYNIEAKSEPVLFFERLISKFEKFVVSEDSTTVSIKRKILALKKKFPGILHFTFLSSNGEPLTELCDSPPSKFLLKKFYQEYCIAINNNTTIPDSQRTFIQGFLGKFVSSSKPAYSKIFFASESRKKRFVYIARPGSNFFFIVHISQPDTWDILPLNSLMNEFNRINKSVRFAYYDFNSRKIFPQSFKDAFIINEEELLKKIYSSPHKLFLQNNSLVSAKFVSPKISILCSRDFTSEIISEISKKKSIIMLIALLTASIILLTPSGTTLSLSTVSVKFKLMFIFILITGIPAGIILFNLVVLTSEKEKTFQKKLFSDVLNELTRFDSTFNSFIDIFGKHILSDLELIKSVDGKKISGELERFLDKTGISFARLYNSEGKIVFRREGDLRITSGNYFFDAFGKTVKKTIAKIFSGEIDPGKKVKLEDFQAKHGGDFNESLFLSFLVSSIGASTILDTGDIKLVLTSHFFKGTEINNSFFLLMFSEKESVEEMYIRKHLLQVWRNLPETRVWAVWGNEMENILPLKRRWSEKRNRFINDLEASGKTLTRVEKSSTKNTLLTGIRCDNLGNRFLMAVSSDYHIKRDLDKIKKNVFALIALIILFALLSVLFLTGNFLIPASRLSEAVDNLQKRNFDFQVKITGSYEWKNLLSTFNTIMSGMKELESAKALQEDFFSTEILTLKQWQIQGVCIPALQVGGDYYEFTAIDERRALIFLGDVSGHGTSAALVVAMAKSLLVHPLTPRSPEKILQILNAVFIKVLRKRKMMTCVAALLDADSGKISFSGAGQTYPLLIRDGVVSEIAIPGLPLGIKKNHVSGCCELLVEPGDVILFYTDGIIEYPDCNNVVIGYKRFYSVLPALVGNDCTITRNNIMSWLKSVTNNVVQPDDVTLLTCQMSEKNNIC
ncbi:MAG: SpoIIE family protein phosphatase [Candidatus Riflebacteria bacterium]|nr:SpoIIE family protein phosphatase [Candidatus Riflebacteria bacterium]